MICGWSKSKPILTSSVSNRRSKSTRKHAGIEIAIEALVFGCIAFGAAAFPLFISMFLYVFIPLLAAELFRSRWRSARRTVAIVSCAVSISTSFAVLLFAALYVPTKNEQRLLAKTIRFHSDQITLSEFMAYYTQHRAKFPVYLSMRFAASNQNVSIPCPNKSITLGELIVAFHRQAGLKHKFSGCGESWTLLNGGDCSTLSVWDPKVMGANAEPEYDQDAHLYQQP